MAEEAKSELAILRAEYRAIVGKNPSPKLKADGLRAKIAELKAPPAPAEPPVAGDPPAAADPPADPPVAAPEPAPAPEAGEIPHGTALLAHDDPDASCSFNGVELAPNKKGLFLVPLIAVEQLQPHGFRLVGAGK